MFAVQWHPQIQQLQCPLEHAVYLVMACSPKRSPLVPGVCCQPEGPQLEQTCTGLKDLVIRHCLQQGLTASALSSFQSLCQAQGSAKHSDDTPHTWQAHPSSDGDIQAGQACTALSPAALSR